MLCIEDPVIPPAHRRSTPGTIGAHFAALSGDQAASKYIIVEIIELISTHIRKTPDSPVPDVGTLPDGTPYFIYRFLLYADGFSPYLYTQGSIDGIYIIPINFGNFGRNSSNVGRVVCVARANVSAFSVYTQLVDDIKNGASIGYYGRDVDGIKRKVFLDLVGIIGDTPALNYALEVSGTGGDAFCHHCNIHRSIGSRRMR